MCSHQYTGFLPTYISMRASNTRRASRWLAARAQKFRHRRRASVLCRACMQHCKQRGRKRSHGTQANVRQHDQRRDRHACPTAKRTTAKRVVRAYPAAAPVHGAALNPSSVQGAGGGRRTNAVKEHGHQGKIGLSAAVEACKVKAIAAATAAVTA